MLKQISGLATVAGILCLVGAASAQAAFPGANGKIAFDRSVPSERFGSASHVFTANPDGGVVDLTAGDSSEHHPEWSADGRKLAFVGFGVIQTMDAAGASRTLLATGNFSVWSPDGTMIAFSREGQLTGPVRNYDVFVMNADGTAVVNLIGDPPGNLPFDTDPAWSPDGTRIAFASSGRDSLGPGIYTMTATGHDLRQVTSGAFRGDFSPDWSPDGSKIAFERYRFDGDDGEIYVVNADGTDLTRLTDNDVNDRSPSWSPDGSKIAFDRPPDIPSGDIWVMNSDGSDQAPVIAGGTNPDWQPLNRAPDCSRVASTPGVLVPPNHELVPVSLTGATDPDGDRVSLAVTGVTQDEPLGGKPDAITGSTPDQVSLRAERRGGADGRVYRIAFQANDSRGGTCAGTANVTVPKGNRPAVDSAPPSYDSFGS